MLDGGEMLEQTRETILVVDDEPITRSWLSSVLLDEGYTVLQASDGVDALDVAHRLVESAIDLLVTDFHMTIMDGPAGQPKSLRNPSQNVREGPGLRRALSL
jgi:CheY-like chemotaxis protein